MVKLGETRDSSGWESKKYSLVGKDWVWSVFTAFGADVETREIFVRQLSFQQQIKGEFSQCKEKPDQDGDPRTLSLERKE